MDFDDRDFAGVPQKAYYDDPRIQREVEAAYKRARLSMAARRERRQMYRDVVAALLFAITFILVGLTIFAQIGG